jgi:hypothetical protein
MTVAENLKKLETILQNAERSQLWGTVELQFNNGELATIRESKVTKLQSRRGNSRDDQNHCY